MVRLRLAELLKQRTWTGYQLAQASDGRLSIPTVYRLLRENRAEGPSMRRFDGAVLEALCDALQVELAELLVRVEVRSRPRRQKVRRRPTHSTEASQ